MSKLMLESNVPLFHAQFLSNSEGRDQSHNNVVSVKKWSPMTCSNDNGNKNNNNSNNNNGPSNREILFLQEKRDELLRQLHHEIRQLKTENSELKFQLYVVLKAHNNPTIKSELKTVAMMEMGSDGEECVQIASNNGKIEVNKNYSSSCSNNSGHQSSLDIPDHIKAIAAGASSATATVVHDDANQLKSWENVNTSRKQDGRNTTFGIQRNESLSPVTPKRLPTATATRHHKPEDNIKSPKMGNKEDNKLKAITGIGIQSKFNFPEKYVSNLKEGKSHTSRASIPNNATSNYGLPLAHNIVPRSSSASSKRTSTLKQHSLLLLPSNYKDNVATLPPIVVNHSPRNSTGNVVKVENLVQQVKPWCNSQTGRQKFNPSAMTKQKAPEKAATMAATSPQQLSSEKPFH